MDCLKNNLDEKKLLTICLPTYNRSTFLKMQLDRFSKMPLELWSDITVFVSDNCSNDGTMDLCKQYTYLEDTDFIYSRNVTNLGMDGNFVKCFKSAKTKYVWLLGDDDTIIIERLPLLLSKLKEKEVGVLHIGHNRNTDQVFNAYDNAEQFLREIGIYTTFISANIVNVRYVPEIDFEKYYGSFFTLIPLYLTAMIKEPFNVMINIPLFEAAKDPQRNGGYGICTVFIENYLRIFREFVDKGLLTETLYSFEKETVFNYVKYFVLHYYILKQKSNYKSEDTWGILFRHYGKSRVLFSYGRSIIGYYYHLIKGKKYNKQ